MKEKSEFETKLTLNLLNEGISKEILQVNQKRLKKVEDGLIPSRILNQIIDDAI